MQSSKKYNHAGGIKDLHPAFFTWPVILLVLFGLLFTGCKKENIGNDNQKSTQATTKEEISVNRKQVSKLYDENTCLTLSDMLYEWYLYSYQSKEEAKSMVQQSAEACGKILEKNPDGLEAKINLIGSRYLLPRYYTREMLDADKVEETVRAGVAKGLEEARLLMGRMVGGHYFEDTSNRIELLLPLMASDNPKILTVVGGNMQTDKTTNYRSIDPEIATKYLPENVAIGIKKFKNLIAKDTAEAARMRKDFGYIIASIAFKKAYAINKDILAGYELGLAHMDGLGVREDTAKALEYLHDVVDRGSPRGYFDLGLIYSKLTNIGNEVAGFVKDQEKSIALFEQALIHDDGVPKYALSRIYLDKKFGYYNKVRGTELYCQIPIAKRPKKTVYSQQPIRINCDSR